jgi:hypothetical protein
LGQGSYLGLHGLATGAIAIIPLSHRSFEGLLGVTTKAGHALVSGKRRERSFLEVRLKAEGEVLKAGTEWKTALLFLLDNRPQWQPEQLQTLVQSYGLRDRGLCPGISVLHGERDLSRVHPFTIRAKNGCAVVAVRMAEAPLGLPLIVRGLNRNWDAAVYEMETQRLRRIGAVEDEGYALLDGSADGTHFVGNLVECDHPEVRVTVEDVNAAGIRFTAHNPTNATIAAVIRRPDGLEWYPAFNREATLPPGACLGLSVP